MQHFEFWHPRVFEAPYYAHLLSRCALKGISPRTIPKANWALPDGELGLGTKYQTQMAFDQSRFPATALARLPKDCAQVHTFAQNHGFPFILKPLLGTVGKGVLKASSPAELEQLLTCLSGDYLLQSFCPHSTEFGVFYIHKAGIQRITGINQKHFPTVIGNGRDDLQTLATAHPRFTHHWSMFLRYLDTSYVPAEGESYRLSFIGSHTMGCKFTDDTALSTPALERAVFSICDSQPGFNFGRFDVKAESLAAFQDGQFTVMEVNGISSLPTHMFDPDNTLRRAYQIFLEHGRHLVDIAYENRNKEMHVDGYGELWQRAKQGYADLNVMQETAKGVSV